MTQAQQTLSEHVSVLKNSVLAWFVWLLGATFAFYQFMIQTAPSVMSDALMHSFHITGLGVGVLSASYFVPYLLLQIPAGNLIDHYGVRRLYLISMPIAVIGCLGFSLSHNVYLADFFRMVTGMATATGVVGAMTLAANWFDTKHFALMAGLVETFCLVGGAAGEHGLSFLVDEYDWRLAAMILVIGGSVLFAAVWLWLRDAPNQLNVHHEPQQDKTPIMEALVSLFKNKQMVANSLFCGLAGSIVAVFASLWCVSYIRQLYHISIHRAAFLSALIFIGAAIGSPTLGWLSDKIGRRKPVMAVGTLLSLGLILFILWGPSISLPTMCWLLLLLGFFSSCYMLSFAITQESIELSLRGAAIGLTNMMCMSGCLLLQPAVGAMLQLFWHGTLKRGVPFYSLEEYRLALLLLPACLVLSLLCLLLIEETHCQPLRDKHAANAEDFDATTINLART